MCKVHEAKGEIVPGLCDRNGHKMTKGSRGKWGGKRVKSNEIKKETWLEPFASKVLDDQKQFIKSKYLLAYHGIDEEQNADDESC